MHLDYSEFFEENYHKDEVPAQGQQKEGSFLDELPDTQSTGNLADMTSSWSKEVSRLYTAYLDAEKAYTLAKNAYEEYTRNTLPLAMHELGLSEFKTKDFTVVLNTVTHVSVKKAEMDSVCKWVEEHKGPAIKDELVVPSELKQTLQDMDVPFKENKSINSNTLKAWLVRALGQKGSVAEISVADIPDGISFFQYEEAQVLPV